MRSIATTISFFLFSVLASVAQTPQPPEPKDSLSQCEETIRQRLAPTQAQYARDLDALMKAFQAKGDLENLLVVKKEQERTKASVRVWDDNIVQTPVELRNIQLKYKASQDKISQQAEKELLTQLEDRKKKLTIEGKIDEALSVKKEIEKIQQRNVVSTEVHRGATPVAEYPVRRLIVRALIDGKSRLKVQANKIWWENLSGSNPGIPSGSNEPILVNHQKWSPEWDGKNSKPLESTRPFLPAVMREISIRKIRGRGAVKITEQPTSSNQNTLAVVFDDDEPHADRYEVELYW